MALPRSESEKEVTKVRKSWRERSCWATLATEWPTEESDMCLVFPVRSGFNRRSCWLLYSELTRNEFKIDIKSQTIYFVMPWFVSHKFALLHSWNCEEFSTKNSFGLTQKVKSFNVIFLVFGGSNGEKQPYSKKCTYDHAWAQNK